MNSQARDLRRAGALKVLLIVLGVIFGGCILICAGCLTFAYFKGKPFMADVFRQVAAVPLDSDRLPQEQKDRIQASIDRVVSGVKANQIGYVKLAEIMDKLSTGPYANLAMIELARSRIAVLLDQDQKRWEEASLVIDRLARGVSEGRIAGERLERVLAHVTQTGTQVAREVKPSLTEVEAEDFLEAAGKEVERAKIPSEPYQVDLAGELQKAIDKVLGGSAATSTPAATGDDEAAPSEPESEPESEEEAEEPGQ